MIVVQAKEEQAEVVVDRGSGGHEHDLWSSAIGL